MACRSYQRLPAEPIVPRKSRFGVQGPRRRVDLRRSVPQLLLNSWQGVVVWKSYRCVAFWVAGIHSGAAIHCWPNPRAAAAEIARVLKPGGVFVGSTFMTWDAPLGQVSWRL